MMLFKEISHLWMGAGVGRMLCLPYSQRKGNGELQQGSKDLRHYPQTPENPEKGKSSQLSVL